MRGVAELLGIEVEVGNGLKTHKQGNLKSYSENWQAGGESVDEETKLGILIFITISAESLRQGLIRLDRREVLKLKGTSFLTSHIDNGKQLNSQL
ncbi:hypothetical protein FRX31_027202 [Thalictrum thalictroides]|uniref:Uncharacterized protein n=1 Tax=Thalictrum thalictroides TaxID=46969 RepID=A0A7J6VFX5_THATH|nr:hypothetical protein FRX31_027202 [Thalictrum thalictroides]